MFKNLRENLLKLKNNSGISLVSLLITIGLLAVFVTLIASFFKDFYKTKATLDQAQKALGISSTIVYDAFDSIGILADNLGRGNCQNLNFEDILTDIYQCACSDGDDDCKTASCIKANTNTRTFFMPILGINKSDYEEVSFSGNALSYKFSSVYKNIIPQTKDQLKANGMPENIINRCFNNTLIAKAKTTNMTAEAVDEMMREYEKKALSQEYFTLIIKLLEYEIKISDLYTKLLSNLPQDNSNIKVLKKYKYPIRNNITPNPSESNFLINCNNELTENKRSDQKFTCESYTLNQNATTLLNSTSIREKYTELQQAFSNIKSQYDHVNQDLITTVEQLIKFFNITISESIETDSETTENQNSNLEESNQDEYSYLDNVIRLYQLIQVKGYDNSDYDNLQRFNQFVEKYNHDENPFDQDFDIKDLLALGRFCETYSVYACFNVQDNGSGTEFLAGTNPNTIIKEGKKQLNCYGEDANNTLCKDRSSVILEIKAFPMSMDSPTNTEKNIQFYEYNDSGAPNRLLKMLYILHWTQKIDGTSYKYFRKSGSFTMATSSNLRK